jgi:hypothetical protein
LTLPRRREWVQWDAGKCTTPAFHDKPSAMEESRDELAGPRVRIRRPGPTNPGSNLPGGGELVIDARGGGMRGEEERA